MRSAISRPLAAISVLVCASMAGCSFNAFSTFRVNDEQLRYAENIPEGVSFAWRQNDKVWVVPSKNVYIGMATGLGGEQLQVRPDGSYFSIERAPPNFLIEIDGVMQQLSVPQ